MRHVGALDYEVLHSKRVFEIAQLEFDTFVDWLLAIYGTAAVPFPQLTEITKPDTATARLTFPTQPGAEYQVFESTTLAPGSWLTSGATFTATTAETTHDLAVPPLAERLFFRVAPVD